MILRPILLTFSVGDTPRRQVWSGRKPLSLGSRRWTLQRVTGGVELRGANRTYRFDHSQLEWGARLNLEGASIELKSCVELLPVHQRDSGSTSNGRLRIYHHTAGWTRQSLEVQSSFEGVVEEMPAFRLIRSGSGYQLLGLSSKPLTIVTGPNLSDKKELRTLEKLMLSAEALAACCISTGLHQWTFNRPEDLFIPTQIETDSKEWQVLRSSMGSTAAVSAAFLLFLALWPRPEKFAETEPPALPPMTLVRLPSTKVAMKMAMKVAAAPSSLAAPSKSASHSTQHSAATAFEGNRLESAMKGLFRGGMTQLLQKSEFTSGADHSESSRKLFHDSSAALHSTAPVTGPRIGPGTRIAALGGDDGGLKKGVGYGQGEHANVSGQGHSLISMDTTGSSVDEGLTRDQVGEVIHRHMSEVRYCYESSMMGEPDLEGKLVMGFTINATGKVKIAAVRSSTLTDSKLDDCITRRLSAWRFPLPKGGIDVAVTYPFIFKSLGG